MIVCNTRNLQNPITGVQRYTIEILEQLKEFNGIRTTHPEIASSGIFGHAWEQCILPFKLNGDLLWSPSNTGPLAVENQVLSLMDCSPLDHPEWSSPQFSSWYQFLLPRLLRKVRKIITISEFSKSRILAHCPDIESKIEITLLASNERFMPSDDLAITTMLSRLKIPSKHYIVALGSIEPRKNLQALLAAWAKISPDLPEEVWLVLAGGAGKRLVFGDQSFESLPPRVFLTGRVNDDLLPALYSGAIASVYLSLYEGFGLPPLEAMACGTPVITSNCSSLPEVVGDAAILVDPLDIDSICHELKRVVGDALLRDELSAQGLLRAREFSWKKTAIKTLDILNKAVK